MIGVEEIEELAGRQLQQGVMQPGNSQFHAASRLDGPAWHERTLELHASLNHSLNRYLLSLGLSADQADDALQETFLRLAGHLKEGGRGDNLRSWLFQVAHNLSMDTHRASRRDWPGDPESYPETVEEPVDTDANPERMYIEKEQRKRLMAAMSRLTMRQRNSILLRAKGLRYREIADVLGVSEQRAIHLVKRGLLQLTGGL
jgi:RNA polymerase sigma-70 factor (ECF subfamily)